MTSKRTVSVLAALALGGAVHGPAAAADYPPMYVYGENDGADARACNISTPGAIATAQAALRGKGIQVASQNDYFNDRALAVYITSTVTSTCAAVIALSVQTTIEVINPVTKGKHSLTVAFCNETSILTGADLQNRINTDVVTLLGACLDKYIKSIR